MTREQGSASDDGFTLVELIVYGLLLVVVLGIVGSIMISSLNIEQEVRASTESTTTAQLAAESIVAGVRNGTARELTSVGDDQLLRIRTAGGNPGTVTWHCAAWYYSPSTGTIRTTRTVDDTVGVPSPTAEPLDWALIAEGVTTTDPSGEIFTATADGVRLNFTAEAGQGATVVIDSSATLRAGGTEGASCFT